MNKVPEQWIFYPTVALADSEDDGNMNQMKKKKKKKHPSGIVANILTKLIILQASKVLKYASDSKD